MWRYVVGGIAWPDSEVVINGGSFKTTCVSMILFAGGAIQKVSLNGGRIESTPQAHCISLNGSKNAASRGEKLELVINGCYLTSKVDIISLNPNISEDWNSYYIHFENGTLRTTGEGFTGAIGIGSSVPEGLSAIKEAVQRDDIEVFTKQWSINTTKERTYKELIFKDGELISQTDNVDDSEDNNQNEPTSPNTNEINSEENNPQQNEDTDKEELPNDTIENDTKLPQTGEENNVFVKWLSIVILLGILWLVSMLLIDREKKKMTKK